MKKTLIIIALSLIATSVYAIKSRIDVVILNNDGTTNAVSSKSYTTGEHVKIKAALDANNALDGLSVGGKYKKAIAINLKDKTQGYEEGVIWSNAQSDSDAVVPISED